MSETGTDISSYEDIPGWFRPIDVRVFRALLQSPGPPGDLVEIGVFKGKSAAVIGDHVRPGERFVCIDIFGDTSLLSESVEDREIAAENESYYPTLSLDAFTANYLALHDTLPVVVQAASTEIVKHVDPGAARFIHVDASHLYAGVAADCRSALQLLRPGGVVAFDDWRNPKCPGVAAAIWESVVRDGLIPVATTRKKLYAARDRPDDALQVIRELVAAEPEVFFSEDHHVMGHTLVRLEDRAELDKLAHRRQAAAGPPPVPPRRRWFGR